MPEVRSAQGRSTQVQFARAAIELGRQSEVIRRLREQAGPPKLPERARSAFEALGRSIVYQQLAGAAAATIWRRVLECTGAPLTAEGLNRASDANLRAAGLSQNKLLSLRDLSSRAKELRLGTIHHQADSEVAERLVVVRGIGLWTAHMFLIFHLRRVDVWPTADLGVREGYRRAFGLSERPSARELETQGAQFSPYRSIAAWYLWRAVELLPG
jgi:3-methyladenine DNA glycosylase/8-oxoguanine DNA glycosylase